MTCLFLFHRQHYRQHTTSLLILTWYMHYFSFPLVTALAYTLNLPKDLYAQASAHTLFPLANHKSCSPDFFFCYSTWIVDKTWPYMKFQLNTGNQERLHATFLLPACQCPCSQNLFPSKKKISFLVAWHFSSTTKARSQKRTFVSFPNCP